MLITPAPGSFYVPASSGISAHIHGYTFVNIIKNKTIIKNFILKITFWHHYKILLALPGDIDCKISDTLSLILRGGGGNI